MSLAKYMQLYREYGFFNGSTIRVRIPDTSFYGSDLILSKDGNILRTRTIDDDVVDFFTDESGTLVLSADNGTSTLSGEVKISAYGTYNITLEGTSVDKSREVYAEKDVTLDDGKTTDSVAIGYTGDISPISAVSSNASVCTVSVNGNKVIVKDAGKDFNGKSTITATVEASQNYDAGEVNFFVNKLNGSLGTWEDASDEVIASMIAQADAGEINLADYWNIGDTRRVHLNEIAAGTETAMQTEQDIDLVILHNPLGDSKYMLTTPTMGNRYQPHFIIGTKECLEGKTAFASFKDTITATHSSYSTSYNSYLIANSSRDSELLTMLNEGFASALPQYLQGVLKPTNRQYLCLQSGNIDVGDDIINHSIKGVKSHKVSLANLNELGFTASVTRNTSAPPIGTGVYDRSGTMDDTESHSPIVNRINSAVNGAGTKFSYYTNNSIIKHKGNTSILTDYHVADTLIAVTRYEGNGSSYDTHFSMAFYVDINGSLTTNNLADSGQRTALRGISPIMFI